jgi:hypothetical protein
MFSQAQMRFIVTFLSGVVVGVAGIFFLGGRDQITTVAAQASEQKSATQTDQKEVAQVSRYQAFNKLDIPNTSYPVGLLDTATGKAWRLQAMGNDTYKWMPLAEAPK